MSQRHQSGMYWMGMTKPVKMTRIRIRMAAGTIAWDSVRDEEAIVLKIIDMVMTVKKVNRRKKKNAPGVRLRFVMKYNVKFEMSALRIL